MSFAELHRPGEPLLLPNAWDRASAAAFAAAGFAAVATTSLGVAAAAGVRDASGAGRGPTVALAEAICGGPVHVSADVENGYSDDPVEVAALAARLRAAGVAGINLEDGTAAGGLRDAGHHAAIIEAVVAAAPGLFVNARTDTVWLGAGDAAETERRIALYARAGAHGIFVPGVAGRAEIARLAAASPLPFNALLAPGGPGVGELGALGVARVSFGSLLFRIALGAAVAALRDVAAGAAPQAGPALGYDAVQALAPE